MDYTKRIGELNKKLETVIQECPEVTYVGNPILRTRAEEVSLEEGLEISKKLQDVLLRYRKITGYGRGLAAPQIGKAKSVFVTYVDDVFKTYINPKIICTSEKVNYYRETCLSCGYLSVDVERPDKVEIKYTDENGENCKDKENSFIARLIQHEYDHLEGVVNIDKAEPKSIEIMFDDPLQEKIRDKYENLCES